MRETRVYIIVAAKDNICKKTWLAGNPRFVKEEVEEYCKKNSINHVFMYSIGNCKICRIYEIIGDDNVN